MRVWILDPAAMTPYYDISLTNALRAAGVEVRLISSRFIHDSAVPRAEQCTDHFFFRPLARWAETLKHSPWLRRAARLVVYPFDLIRLWNVFRQAQPDVIHIQWTWLPILDHTFFRFMAARTPLVLTIHNPLPRAASMARIADMRPLYDLAIRLIVHADENRQVLLSHTNIAPERVYVVPHGPQFENQPVMERYKARESIGLEADSRVVLFFGAIRPYKGLMDLIEAMALLHEICPIARLLIAGKPECPIKPYLDALAEHCLEGITTLHLGFIPTEQVAAFFAASDVVCLPYREASQSGVLLTAYRFGKAVVVTDVGGLPESVEEGKNGYIVPSANPPSLASALGKLLLNPALQERFGARSQELAQTRFGWERAAALTVEVYQQAIAEFSIVRAAGEGEREA